MKAPAAASVVVEVRLWMLDSGQLALKRVLTGTLSAALTMMTAARYLAQRRASTRRGHASRRLFRRGGQPQIMTMAKRMTAATEHNTCVAASSSPLPTADVEPRACANCFGERGEVWKCRWSRGAAPKQAAPPSGSDAQTAHNLALRRH